MLQRWLCTALLLSACGSPAPIDAGMDAGMDAGQDAGMDAGPPWTGPGCDPVTGIECDGDWEGRCAGGCSPEECCSPQRAMTGSRGNFLCVPRGADGSCPAANIWVDEDRIVNGTTGEDFTFVTWRYFAADDCALVEGCVDQPGWRRLLRFATWTPNTGNADLFLGVPRTDSPQFEYSACHDHYHFNGYAEYGLQDSGGAEVATGHKQAFCLLDFYQYPGTNETGWYYTCNNQGIQQGWQDVYDETLDCQWIDVTDVAPGDYTLVIDLNVDHTLLESNYDDNHAEVPVTIPVDGPVDVTLACPGDRTGDVRDCEWLRQTQTDPYACTPGASVRAACASSCSLGSCTGDTVLRICDPMVMGTAVDNNCAGMAVLGSNDDANCGDTRCSQVSFTCPDSGAFVAYYGAYDPNDGSTVVCNLAVQ